MLLFGTAEHGRMHLSTYGKIVAEEWQRTGDLRDEVSLDAFIVMPDHVHGLLWICHSDEEPERKENSKENFSKEKKPGKRGRKAQQNRKENRESRQSPKRKWERKGREMHLATSSNLPPGLEKRRAGTLSTIMGCFKAAVTRRINEKRDTPGETVWQSSFHDHIVGNRKELHRIRRYIRTNPQQWSQSD